VASTLCLHDPKPTLTSRSFKHFVGALLQLQRHIPPRTARVDLATSLRKGRYWQRGGAYRIRSQGLTGQAFRVNCAAKSMSASTCYA